MDRSKLVNPRFLIIFFIFSMAFVVSSVRLVEYSTDLNVWLWIGGTTIGMFVFLGPVLWLIRARVNLDRHDFIQIIALGLLFIASTIFSSELPLRDESHLIYAVTLGVTLGYTITVVIELIAIDKSLQSPDHRF